MVHTLTDSEKCQAGIYAITNSLDSRIYVGATVCLVRAFYEARKTLRNGCHGSRQLQAFADAHGLPTLRFELIELCAAAELSEAKQRHISQRQACDPIHGFNVMVTMGLVSGQALGAEHRERISQGKRGRSITPRTAEHQEKLAAAHRGRQRSPETCAAIAAAVRGKPKKRAAK